MLFRSVIKSNILWVIVLFIALIIHFFNRISNFGKRVEYTYTEKISLEITKENITIEDKKYNWKNVNNIKIEYSDFDGKQIFRSFYDLNPSVSSGINNFISFTTTENESISYKFQLHSSEQIDVLREVFREMAKEKTVRLETIKLLYQPINYADHQKIKSIYENINN